MVHGVWFMVYGLWFVVYGLWFMDYGLWCMVYGLEFGFWSLEVNRQPLSPKKRYGGGIGGKLSEEEEDKKYARLRQRVDGGGALRG